MATTPQTDAARQVAAIQRRLERWELTHLRALCATLADRLEKAEADLERARDDAASAWCAADAWASEADTLVQELRQDCKDVGLTQDGHLVVVPTSDALPPWTDAVLGTAYSQGSFYTVPELLRALGMDQAKASPNTEAALRGKLENMGASKVKRAPLAGGPPAWGYYLSPVGSGEPAVAPVRPQEPHTPEAQPGSCTSRSSSRCSDCIPPKGQQPTEQPGQKELGQSSVGFPSCSSIVGLDESNVAQVAA